MFVHHVYCKKKDAWIWISLSASSRVCLKTANPPPQTVDNRPMWFTKSRKFYCCSLKSFGLQTSVCWKTKRYPTKPIQNNQTKEKNRVNERDWASEWERTRVSGQVYERKSKLGWKMDENGNSAKSSKIE